MRRFSLSVWGGVLVAAGVLGGCGSSQTTLVASDTSTPVAASSPGEFRGPGQTQLRMARLGPNLFSASVESVKPGLEAQKREDSCWAACAVALLRHAGAKNVDQEDLIRAYGQGGADELKLVRAIGAGSQGAREVDGAVQQVAQGNGSVPWVRLAAHTATSDDLVERLGMGEPVVVGLHGDQNAHLRVVYGVEFAEVDKKADAQFKMPDGKPKSMLGFMPSSSDGRSGVYVKYAIHKLYVYDPIPSRGYGEMSGEEMAKEVNFILARSMADGLLRDTYQQWQQDRQNARNFNSNGKSIDVGNWLKKRF